MTLFALKFLCLFFKKIKKNLAMKKLILCSIFSLFCFQLAIAQHSETRVISHFTNIDYEGYGELHLIKGDSFSVEIDTKKHYQLSNIMTEVKGNTLHIYYQEEGKDNFWNTPARFPRTNIYVTYQTIDQLDLAGKVKVFSPDAIHSDRFDLTTSGYVVGDLEVYTQNMEVESEGYIKMKLAGEANSMEADLGGVGRLDALDLFTDYCEVEIEGTTTFDVYVREELDAEISGVATLYYEGKPRKTNIDRNGLVRVRSCRN